MALPDWDFDSWTRCIEHAIRGTTRDVGRTEVEERLKRLSGHMVTIIGGLGTAVDAVEAKRVANSAVADWYDSGRDIAREAFTASDRDVRPSAVYRLAIELNEALHTADPTVTERLARAVGIATELNAQLPAAGYGPPPPMSERAVLAQEAQRAQRSDSQLREFSGAERAEITVFASLRPDTAGLYQMVVGTDVALYVDISTRSGPMWTRLELAAVPFIEIRELNYRVGWHVVVGLDEFGPALQTRRHNVVDTVPLMEVQRMRSTGADALVPAFLIQSAHERLHLERYFSDHEVRIRRRDQPIGDSEANSAV